MVPSECGNNFLMISADKNFWAEAEDKLIFNKSPTD